jgi:hypothetical protein
MADLSAFKAAYERLGCEADAVEARAVAAERMNDILEGERDKAEEARSEAFEEATQARDDRLREHTARIAAENRADHLEVCREEEQRENLTLKGQLESWEGRAVVAEQVERAMDDTRSNIVVEGVPPIVSLPIDVLTEIDRQDKEHGAFEGSILGASRLAIACIEDEVQEVLLAWLAERKALNWDQTREEVLQLIAVSIRALRDVL